MKQAQARPTTVLGSDWIDFGLSGGTSIILFAFVMMFMNRTTPDGQTSWFIYYLSFVVNFPHFLASYQLLYYDYRKKINLKNMKFLWAAVIAPIVLITSIAVGFANADKTLLGKLVQVMYFTVGWHYVKQVLGVMIVLNARKNIFLDATERWWLKTHLFSIWAWSFVNANVGDSSYALEGISYPSLNLPRITWSIAAATVTVTGFMVFYQLGQKWIRDGKFSSWPALGALVSLYCWYLPTLYHPVFWLVVPFFHSLQYLLFVFAYKRNEVVSKFGWPNNPEARLNWVKNYGGYILTFALTGAFFMHILPRWMDQHNPFDLGQGVNSWVFASTIFINIHHYFIDNVLWRAHNPEMQEYLFKPVLPALTDASAGSARKTA